MDTTKLLGSYISSVCFVSDYIELGLNGPILRFLSNPVVSDGLKSYLFPEPGSRDALCLLIDKMVSHFEIVEGKYVRLVADGIDVKASLNEMETQMPEAFHFVPGIDMPIQVW